MSQNETDASIENETDSDDVEVVTAVAVAALGVGAIAAAPFVGGLSLFAAGGFAAYKAIKVIAEISGDETQIDEAECELKVEQLTKQMETYLCTIDERKSYFDAALAMTAVGISAANCDGEIHDEESKTIEQYIAGICVSSLPESLKNSMKILIKEMEKIYDAPPELKSAFNLAHKANVPMWLCDEIIQVVIEADGVIETEEHAFLMEWRRLDSAV